MVQWLRILHPVQGRIHCINRMKEKKKNTHTIISINTENTFDKMQHPFIMKTLNKLGIERYDHNPIKGHCEKPTAKTVFNAVTRDRNFLSSF